MRSMARKDERKKTTAGEIPTVAEGVICQLPATIESAVCRTVRTVL